MRRRRFGDEWRRDAEKQVYEDFTRTLTGRSENEPSNLLQSSDGNFYGTTPTSIFKRTAGS